MQCRLVSWDKSICSVGFCFCFCCYLTNCGQIKLYLPEPSLTRLSLLQQQVAQVLVVLQWCNNLVKVITLLCASKTLHRNWLTVSDDIVNICWHTVSPLQGAVILFFHVIRNEKVWSKLGPRFTTIRQKALSSTIRPDMVSCLHKWVFALYTSDWVDMCIGANMSVCIIRHVFSLCGQYGIFSQCESSSFVCHE